MRWRLARQPNHLLSSSDTRSGALSYSYAAGLNLWQFAHWMTGPPSSTDTYIGRSLSGNGVPQPRHTAGRRDTRHTEQRNAGLPSLSRELCMGRSGVNASPHCWQFSGSSFMRATVHPKAPARIQPGVQSFARHSSDVTALAYGLLSKTSADGQPSTRPKGAGGGSGTT